MRRAGLAILAAAAARERHSPGWRPPGAHGRAVADPLERMDELADATALKRPLAWVHVPKTGTTFLNTLSRSVCERAPARSRSTTPRGARRADAAASLRGRCAGVLVLLPSWGWVATPPRGATWIFRGCRRREWMRWTVRPRESTGVAAAETRIVRGASAASIDSPLDPPAAGPRHRFC
mmetsp:Transcript_20181/g.60280  ORF Transcript_20181/g.60280 Transcript_20181/m.60280 type:complete len:179 (-) Transcript_20181:1101-1637(-)